MGGANFAVYIGIVMNYKSSFFKYIIENSSQPAFRQLDSVIYAAMCSLLFLSAIMLQTDNMIRSHK